MDNIQDGGSAFPNYISDKMIQTSKNSDTDKLVRAMQGMTLRDYFAGKAVSGILTIYTDGSYVKHFAEIIANEAYIIADAMLKERAKHEIQ